MNGAASSTASEAHPSSRTVRTRTTRTKTTSVPPSDHPPKSGDTLAAPAAPTAPAAPALVYYPQYCFHLSPTFNQWCPMRLADIKRLVEFEDFQGVPSMTRDAPAHVLTAGQNVFFHLNHPVRWVRVAGLVVETMDFVTSLAYVLDDGSGSTITCVAPFRQDTKPADGETDYAAKTRARDERFAVRSATLGAVLAVTGELDVYPHPLLGRQRQIRIATHTVLRGTAQEVRMWAKTAAFARDTLYRPWTLDTETVRACRRAARALQAGNKAGAAQKAGK